MKQLINNWLSGKRNFTVGAILYKQFGSNDELKELFKKGATDYSSTKLLEALTNLVKEVEQPVIKHTVTTYEVMPDGKTDIEKAFKEKWLPIFKEMNFKRHQMHPLIGDDSEEAKFKRGQLAQSILMLEKQCMSIWQQRDYFIATGQLPKKTTPEVKAPVIDKFKAAERLANLKVYIRRYRGLVKKHNKPEHIKYLQQYQQEAEQLTQLHEQE